MVREPGESILGAEERIESVAAAIASADGSRGVGSLAGSCLRRISAAYGARRIADDHGGRGGR